MAQIIREISVDVAKANMFQAIVAKQYDSNSRFLKVTITNQGEPMVIEASSVVTINGMREDGQSAAFLGDVNTDGTVLVPLSNWLLALDGMVKCDITIVDSENRKLTTTMFSLKVEEAAYTGNEISDNPEDDLIVTLLNRCSQIEGYYTDMQKQLMSCLKIGFTWYLDTDTVKDASGVSLGKLQQCMTEEFIGIWFYVRTANSEAGSAVYPSSYKIDGANGYLSLGDYVVWTGTRLVHISTYEAKASTQKNSDGKYGPKSGVDGLMSSTDKAYLTDLINAYWNTKLNTGTSVNANECLENGFYAPMTLGRPNGVKSDERLGLMTIKDSINGGIVQLCISFNYQGRAWFRSSPSNSADSFSLWSPLWSENPFDKFYTQASGGMANWNTEIAVYDTILGPASGGLPPIQNNNYAFTLINVPGAPNATTPYALTQIAIDKATGSVYMRFAPNYSGSGSLSGASEWTRIAENKEPKAMALETRLAAVAEFKGDIGSNWIVRSEDETINGKNVLDCTVKAGWIFTVSADLSETLQLNSAGDALGTLNLSYGDMIILLDSRCDYVNAWRLLYDGSMKSRITENDKKLLEIERKLELHISDWVSVQSIVREGRAPEVFAIGDQLICNHKTYGELVWDIIGFDHDVPVDSTKTHSMTVQLHSIPDSLQFDASEALYYAETELPAGTYNFTLLAGYDVTYGGGKTYYFTIAKPVPAGGQIVFNWGYNKQAADCKIATYGSQTSTTVIETVAVTEGNEGTALSNTNHSHRIRYGSNRWTQSAIRQWLNSDEASGAWWKPSNIYDRPVNYTSSKSGFLNGIDADFISVIGEVTKRNALNTVSDGGGYEDSTERMFLVSRGEVYGGNENGINEGKPYPYYSEFSDLASASTGADVNRIKYKNSTAAYWWLRSCNSGNGNNVRNVNPSGSINLSYASSSIGVAPACNII